MEKIKCRSKKSNLKSARGITLLALVITIIVLIILAGVSISALLGDDGIVEQAGTAEERTNSEGEIEQIQMAYNAELMNNKIEKLGPVTADQLKTRLETNGAKLGETNPVVESADGFQIEFKSGRKYSINVANKEVSYIGGGAVNGGVVVPEGMYSVNEEVTPAPQELFEIVVLDENAKTAKITGMNNDYIVRKIKSEYIGYYDEYYTGTAFIKWDAIDSFYYINHPDITDTLVVPYQVEKGGKMYTVTEVNLDSDCTVITDYGWTDAGLSPIPDVQTIIYPNTVTKIGTARDFTYSLTVEPLSSNLKKVENIIISENLKEIGNGGVFSCCPNLKSITIPSSVTSIGTHAFYNCTGLTNITISNRVTSIGDYAFYNCDSLTSITIPSSVTSIGTNAFAFCDSLTSITIPNSVTSIGDYAFYYCTGLTSITIPNSVTSIGTNAFDSCKGLISITIPNSVTSIGDYAFYYCTGLTSITIPNSVTSIGSYAFWAWTATQTINCQATSQPTNWDEKWNYYASSTPCKATVNWGVSN